MSGQHPAQRVELTCLGTPPTRQIERASGVSDVVIEGQVVRCLVAGSFQPFLEALRGCEVLTLQAAPARPRSSSDDICNDHCRRPGR